MGTTCIKSEGHSGVRLYRVSTKLILSKFRSEMTSI